MTCEEIAARDLLLAYLEDALDADLADSLASHLAACDGCATARAALVAESEVVRDGLRRWTEEGFVVAPPSLRGRARRLRLVVAAAAVLLLVAGIFLLPRDDEPRPDPTALTVLDVNPTPRPGMRPPPSLAQLLLVADGVVEVRVEVATDHLVASRTAVLRGDPRTLPIRFVLMVPPGVSELGPETVRAKVGDRLLLLLHSPPEGRDRLVTQDAYSVIGPHSFAYLETADLAGTPHDDLRRRVAGVLAMRVHLEATGWEKQAEALVRALRSGEGLIRETAICWYARHRLGWASPDVNMLGELRPTRSPLPEVDLALLDLVPPRKGEIGTLSGRSARILLARDPAAWTALLTDPRRGEAAFLLLRAYPRERAAPALREVATGGDATTRYLAAALLATREDLDGLRALLDTTLATPDAASLAGWTHAGIWPPHRAVGRVLNETFADGAEARLRLGE